MKSTKTIYHFLSELRESGVFTPLDLVELEDHLEEEVKFQSNYLEKTEAHSKAIALMGSPRKMVRAYRRRNIWKIFGQQFFYLFGGATFMLLFSDIFYLLMLGIWAVLNPIAIVPILVVLPILAVGIMLWVTYGLKKLFFQSSFKLETILQDDRVAKRLWWILPIVKVILTVLLGFLLPIASRIGDHTLLFHVGLVLAAAPIFWILTGIINLVRESSWRRGIDSKALASLFFWIGTSLYAIFFQVLAYFMWFIFPLISPSWQAYIGISIMMFILITFGWIAKRRKRLEDKVVGWW